MGVTLGVCVCIDFYGRDSFCCSLAPRKEQDTLADLAVAQDAGKVISVLLAAGMPLHLFADPGLVRACNVNEMRRKHMLLS